MHPGNERPRGLNIFAERHHEITLVLSDMNLPVMDGVEMIHQIFSLQPHTNVIVMTGYQMERMLPDDLKKLCSSISKPLGSSSARLNRKITGLAFVDFKSLDCGHAV